jgi:hypothetical protein
MRKLAAAGFLAGTAGTVAGGMRSFRRDEPMDAVVRCAAVIGARAALAGAAMGFLLDRRRRGH